ncbi:MAG: ABC transporter permease [Rhodothermales bacterium]
MLKNYLHTTLRNLWRHKGYAAINVVGLSVGIACSLLIMLFVRSEWTYDRFHEKSDRIYRAWVHESYGEGQEFFNSVTPMPLGPAIAETYPEVEAYVRYTVFDNLVRPGANTLTESIQLVDAAFFEVFDFPLVAGERSQALDGLNDVVLSESAARRLFGEGAALGKTLDIRIGDETFEPFVVSAVAADPPPNSSIQYGVVLRFENGTGRRWSERALQAWFNVSPETYLLLKPGTDADAFQAKLPAMVNTVLGDEVQPGQYVVGLQPIADIHLNTAIPQGIAPVSDPAYSYILATIAFFVLLIACINFTILAIGRSARRATEVGIRKAVGANRSQLMLQFWGETLLLTAITMGVGFALAWLAMPFFNALAGQRLAIRLDGGLIAIATGLFLSVGLLSGAYPAVVMSEYRPIQVLKGAVAAGRQGNVLRKGLIAVQFVLSIALIASTLVIRSQLQYVQTRDLGFDREQVVVVETGVPPEVGAPLVERMRNELAGDPAVVRIGSSQYAFASGAWLELGYRANDGRFREFNVNVVDPEYIDAMGMEMTTGRNFSLDIPSDANQAIIVNEAFVAAYGWDDPLTAQLPGPFGPHRIIGVVRDFNFASLHTEVTPLALVLNLDMLDEGASDHSAGQSPQPKIAIRIRPGDLRDRVDRIERAWNTVAPGQDFVYSFLDQTLQRQYVQEERLGRMVGIASLLAVLIACLGLFGLATLTVSRRTKELGIRKVLGASSAGLVALIANEFVVLVAVSFVIATPVATWAMRRWLDGFAYRVDISPALFVAAGALVLVVALLTVSFQAIRAALADPVDSIRYE